MRKPGLLICLEILIYHRLFSNVTEKQEFIARQNKWYKKEKVVKHFGNRVCKTKWAKLLYYIQTTN